MIARRPVKPFIGDETMAWKPLAAATLAVTISGASLGYAQNNGPYKGLRIQLVGGDGGFDYVTPE